MVCTNYQNYKIKKKGFSKFLYNLCFNKSKEDFLCIYQYRLHIKLIKKFHYFPDSFINYSSIMRYFRSSMVGFCCV